MSKYSYKGINYSTGQRKAKIFIESLGQEVKKARKILDGKEIDRKGKDKELFYNYNYKSNDETFEDLPTLFKRVHSFLDEIIKKNKDKNILIVAHGGISRAIYFYFNEIPEDGDLSVYVPKNCEINTYEI